MRAELPAHQEEVRAAVLDCLPTGPVLTHGAVAALRSRLAARLLPVVASLGPGVEVVVDRYCLGVAACPASGVRQPFEWTVQFATRTLGLAALRQLPAPSFRVLDTVAVAIEDAISESRSLGRWLATQDGPTRAATVAAVATWVARWWVAVPWPELALAHLVERPVWARPLGYGGPVVIKGRLDSVIRPAGRRPDEAVLVSLGRPNDGVQGLDVLAFALFRGFVPLRTVWVEASSGTVLAKDVDVQTLEAASDLVVEVAIALAGMEDGSQVAEIPGEYCWTCVCRSQCNSGIAWMAAQPRFVGGIPVAAA
ncbi:MAG: hypothetical protein ACRDX8_01445 [Acidimicrobiales bacterium]